MSEIQPYTYDPLPSAQSPSTIRLLTLLPGLKGSTIHCELRTVSGIFEESQQIKPDDPKDSKSQANPSFHGAPKYEALSYVWGDANIKVPVTLQGKQLKVTTNLEICLQRLRHSSEPRTLWIDAICVDQCNLDERSAQVQLMAQVYSQATRVLVWLGEEDTNTEVAFTAARKLAVDSVLNDKEYMEYLGIDHETVLSDIRERFSDDRIPELANLELSHLTEEEVNSLERIFKNRSWWTRVWVLQEIALAKAATVVCGSLTIPWDTLQLIPVSNTMQKVISLPRASSDKIERAVMALMLAGRLGMIRQGRQGRLNEPLGGLSETLFWTKGRKCADPRDVVYGILSLMAFAERRIIPDYNKPISMVYTELTRALIEDCGNLNDICHRSGMGPDETPFEWLGQAKISSWVPDYSSQRYSAVVKSGWRGGALKQVFSADNGVMLDVHTTLAEPMNILRLQCINWDSVSHATRISNPSNYQTGSAMVRQWHQIIRDSAYPTGEHISQAFCRTIFRDKELDVANHPKKRLSESSTKNYSEIYLEWHKSTPEVGHPSQLPSDSADALDASLKDGYSFFVTSKGYMGIVSGQTEIGDSVCIVYGCCVPWVLRYAGNTFEDKAAPIPDPGFHMLVGTAYVHGIMDGEVVKSMNGEDISQTIFLV